jgi:uncharacterized membrane protein
MPVGLLALLAVAVLVYFGLAQRILDRMRLTDGQALIFIGLMIVGSFIDIPLMGGTVNVSINVGGALIPIGLVFFLLIRADETREKVRAILAALVTGGVIWGLNKFVLPDTPTSGNLIDPIWLNALVAGVVGYLAGRSRRSAFIAGVLGLLISDLLAVIEVLTRRIPSTNAIGGAGVLDSIVLGGLIAVGLAELVGESRERLQGGPAEDRDVPVSLYNQDENIGTNLTKPGERDGENEEK